MTSDLASMQADAEQTARAAGSLLREAGADLRHVTHSANRDVKLVADRGAEDLIRRHLRQGDDVRILGEETGWSGGGTDIWVIDPLDGTVNFSRGLPLSCVSIALLRTGNPVIGVIYDFHRDEMFSGIVGVGAACNGSPMRVSGTKTATEAIYATGLPPAHDFSAESMARFTAQLPRFKKVRILGSAALSLAYVACGRADIYREESIMSWDVAAGAALVRAAGGDVRWQGEDLERPLTLTAANAALLEDAFPL